MRMNSGTLSIHQRTAFSVISRKKRRPCGVSQNGDAFYRDVITHNMCHNRVQVTKG